MKKKTKIIASAVGVLALSLSLATAPSMLFAKEAVLAKDTYKGAKSAQFFYDKEEGWYWYQDPETGELKKLEPVEAPVSPPSSTLSKDEEYAKKHPLSAQWVRIMLPRYMDQAWNNPTPENVQAYFLVQKFAVERSHEFALTARKVILGNMLLDGSINRPLSAIGVKSANKATNDARDEILKKLTDKVGIFFFYKSTCPHCETQAPILRMAEVNLGFSVIAVSIDGGELKSAQFAQTYKDAGHAKRLGLESVPAIFLMNDKGEFDLISASVISFENLKERILIAAERQGWISKEDAEKTHFTINNETKHNISKDFPALIEAAKTGDVSTLMGIDKEKIEQLKKLTLKERTAIQDEDGFIQPEKLMAIVSKDGKAKAYPYSGKLQKKELKELKNGLGSN